MLSRHLIRAAVVFSCGLWVPATAHAGGIMLYELGTREVGLASAGWAARADDAGTLFRNPAGMSRLEGSNLLFGAQALYGSLGFEPDSNTTVSGNDGGNPVGLVPGGSAFFVHSSPSGWAFGAGALSYFGLAAEYDEGWVGRYYVKESALAGITLMPAASYQVNEWLSLGGGLNAMLGILRQEAAVASLTGGPDGSFRIEDEAWGFGANLGVLLMTKSGMRVGVTYLSPVALDFEDSLRFSGLSPLAQGALGRAGVLGAPLDLGLRVPQSVMVSFHHPVNPDWSVMGNLGWQNWENFGRVDVAIADTLASVTTESPLKDTWHGAFGAEWRQSPAWRFTAGVAYDSTPVEDEDRTVSLPMGKAIRFGVGGQTHASDRIDLGFAYELAYSGDLPVDQNRGPLAGRVSGSYSNTALHFFAVHLEWHP